MQINSYLCDLLYPVGSPSDII